MSRPIIGITPSISQKEGDLPRYYIQSLYTKAILRAGGLPVLLTPTADESILAEYREMCDGFLFSGGPDIDPAHYGEEKLSTCGSLTPARDAFEFALLAHLLRDGVAKCPPILAICRGMQLVNVAFGGTLYQDLPTEYTLRALHRQPTPSAEPCHTADILPDTPFSCLLGLGRVPVNSYHHQAVKALAPGLAPAAYSEDDLLEALYHPEAPFLLAVQWHPERITQFPPQRELFAALIRAAGHKI